MKFATIAGTAIAAVGLAACGSTAVTPPTARPTLSLVVAPTVAPSPTDMPTPSPTPTGCDGDCSTPTPSPTSTPTPSPTEGPCGYGPCQTGVGWGTTCAVPGTTEGGRLIVTWTAGAGQDAPVVPDTITLDGNVVDVTSNPFTSGPYTVGDHSFTYSGAPEGPNSGLLPFTISACAVVTVTTTCSTSGDTGSATFSGVTVGYKLVVADIVADYIPSNPFTMTVGAAGSYTFTQSGENGGVITMVTGNFTIAACAVRQYPPPQSGVDQPTEGGTIGRQSE